MPCGPCTLDKHSLHRALGRGCVPSEYLILGDYPGRDEVTTGHAFCGKAGDFMGAIMSHAAVLASLKGVPSFHMLNMMFCRPTNSINGDTREATIGEILICREHILRSVDQIRPKGVIFVSPISEQYYHNDFPIYTKILHPGMTLRKGGISASNYLGDVRKIADLFKRYSNAR